MQSIPVFGQDIRNKLSMLYNNGIVIAKHIFFYHVYGAENLNSLQIPLDDALYLEHILFQEIHALFHKIYKAGVSRGYICDQLLR